MSLMLGSVVGGLITRLISQQIASRSGDRSRLQFCVFGIIGRKCRIADNLEGAAVDSPRKSLHNSAQPSFR
jgi:hypothetical protein